MDKLEVYKNVALRPLAATGMLWRHRRTLGHLWKKDKKSLGSHIFVTYLVRGEDCGKGILDPLWKVTGWAPFLWDLEIEVTTRCYLKCIMCEHTYWKDKSYLNQDLKYRDFKRLIDGIPNLRWLNLTGEGSPFLNPEFIDMVGEAKRRGIYVDFSHDFVFYDEEIFRKLIEWKVDRIYWSVDGTTAETYERIRVGAKWDDVIHNVKRFVKMKKSLRSPLPEICFRFCFFKDNWEEVSELPWFLRSLVSDIEDYGDEPSINIVALLEFEETKDWAVELPKGVIKETDRWSKILGFTNYWSHVTHVEEEKAPLDYCTFWSEPYIMITGHVVPCCAVLMSNRRQELEKLAFGNIYENPLKDIWYSDKYRKFRRMVVNPRAPVPKVCLGCRAFNTQYRARRYGVWDME